MIEPKTPSETSDRSWSKALGVYLSPKLIAMLLLGFAAGLPFFLVYGVLSAWLREAGISRTSIGFFGWIGLFYTVKFLWAPVVDRFRIPGFYKLLGQRRSWVLLAQFGLVIGLIGTGLMNPQTSLTQLALFVLLVAVSSATQDIAIDAWRVEAAKNDAEQPALAANYQLGYRAGLMVAQTGSLFIAGLLSPNSTAGSDIYTPMAWSVAYWVMAIFVIIGASTVFWAGEPSRMLKGESRWPRLKNRTQNILKGSGFSLAVIFLMFVVLSGLSQLLEPMGNGFSFVAETIISAPVIIVLAICSMAVVSPWLLKKNNGKLLFYLSLFALLSAFVFLFVGIYHLGQFTDPSKTALLTLPIYIAILPFSLIALLVPKAIKMDKTSSWVSHPVAGALLDFLKRYGWSAILILVFIATYRISDFTMGVMAKPLYIDLGYAKESIGAIAGIFGMMTAIAGALIGGIAGMRFGLPRSMVVGAIITIFTNLAFSWLAMQDPAFWKLSIIVGADNFAAGFAGGLLIAYMSSLTNRKFTATQYALFSSLYAIYGKLLMGFSGLLADQVGYVWFFVITAGFGIPALIISIVLVFVKLRERPEISEPLDS